MKTPTPERSVKEIVDKIDDIIKKWELEHISSPCREEIVDLLQTERQKRDEVVEAEREFWEQIVANQKVEIEMLRVKPDKNVFITQPNNSK